MAFDLGDFGTESRSDRSGDEACRASADYDQVVAILGRRILPIHGVDVGDQLFVGDDIVDAVNYRTVTKAMIAHVESGDPMLVERLVAELAGIALGSDERVKEVEVTVEKPGALRHADSVGITIRRSREDLDE